MSSKAITPEVLAILERCAFENHVLKLPPGQLERKLYEAVNKVLVTLGGKWNRKLGGHLFEKDPRPSVEAATETGRYLDQKQELQQFWTPPDLAREMCALAKLWIGCDVLEPSAGTGRLVDAAVAYNANVHAVESDQALVLSLDARLAHRVHHFTSACADFLLWSMANPRRLFDAVVMNPPFANSADVDHIRTAARHLLPGGRLVALCSPHPFFATDTKSRQFCGFLEQWQGTVTTIDAGRFKASGTTIETRLIEIRRRVHPDAAAACVGSSGPPRPSGQGRPKPAMGETLDLFGEVA
jgi:SAM-dependent methyltransferase